MFRLKIVITPKNRFKNRYHSTICSVMAVGYSPYEAIRDVKIQAKEAGANAIICFQCCEELRDFKNMQKPWEVHRKNIPASPELDRQFKQFMRNQKKMEHQAYIRYKKDVNLHDKVRFYKVSGIAVNVFR